MEAKSISQLFFYSAIIFGLFAEIVSYAPD
jgi:hypothetical protein